MKFKPVPLFVGIVLALLIIAWPSPLHNVGEYGDRPAYAAATALLMVCWWVGEAIDINFTALVPFFLFPILNVAGLGFIGGFRDVAPWYLNAYVWLFAGGTVIGIAMQQTGLDQRIALNAMKLIGTKPRRLLAGMLSVSAFISMWISNTATAVMMLTIATSILRQLGCPPRDLTQEKDERPLKHFGAALVAAVAYGASIGGIAALIGTPPNAIFAGYASAQLHHSISFVGYFPVGLPFVCIFLPIAFLVLWMQLGRKDVIDQVMINKAITARFAKLGAMSRQEKLVGYVFLGAVVAWALADYLQPLVAAPARFVMALFIDTPKFGSQHYEALVALTAATVLLLSRVVTIRSLFNPSLPTGGAAALVGSDAQFASKIDQKKEWLVLLLMGGGFALAHGIEMSGLSKVAESLLRSIYGTSLVRQVAIASFGAVGLTASISNTAALNILITILPQSLAVLAVATIACSCDFAFPQGTPPSMLAFGTHYIDTKTMIKAGIMLDILAALILVPYCLWYLVPFVFQ